jgi:hypothetical protein
MICFGSDTRSDFKGSFSSDSGSCFGSGNASLRLERVARQTRTAFVKLRRYIKFFRKLTNLKSVILEQLSVWYRIVSQKFCFKVIPDEGYPDPDPK